MTRQTILVVFVLALCTAWATAQYTNARPGQAGQRTTPNDWPTAQQGQQPSDQDRDHDQNRDRNKPQPKVDDSTLEREVHEQLASHGEFANVNVNVKNGIVHLEGSVPRKEDRKEAKKLAESVPGVRGVKEKLTISSTAGASASSTTGAENTGVASSSSAGASAPSGAMSAQTGTTTGQTGTTAGTSQPSTSAGTSGSVTGQTGSTAGTMGSSTTTQPSTSAGTAGSVSGQTGSTAGTMGSTTTQPNTSAGTAGSVSGQTDSTAGTTGSMAGQTGTSTSGQSGTAGAIGAQAGTAQSQTGTMTTEHNDLAGQIQTALQHEPTLANDNISVNATDDTVELSGTVATGKEKQTAKRIAESFAGNRKVVDHITVSGRGRNDNSGMGTQGNNPPPQK